MPVEQFLVLGMVGVRGRLEMAFAKLKSALKNAAARTREDLWEAIAQAIATFTPTECTNYFAAAGYARD